MINFYRTLYKWNFILAFGFLWLITFTDEVLAQRINPKIQKKAELISQKCNFTFELLRTKEFSMRNGKFLAITTVLEEKYFTTEQLKKYFTCWSKEFPQIALLTVSADSDRAEVQAWLEQLSRSSDPPYYNREEEEKTPPNHYEANYTRSADDGKESFFYNPDPKSWKRLKYKFKKPTVPLLKRKK